MQNDTNKNNSCSFEIFRSNVCHTIKRIGELNFIKEMITNNDIIDLFEAKEYAEGFYLLAMLDYLSRINDLPLCDKYDNIRNYKLDKKIYSTSILISYELFKDTNILKKAEANAIPEFMNFNIVEGELLNEFRIK